MTIFTVHSPPASDVSSDDSRLRTRFIPESKAILALVFPLIWLLWHRLWWPALFYLLISIALALGLATQFGVMIGLLTFIPGLYLFLEGHELRRHQLERRGWRLTGIVEGSNLASAEMRYFHIHDGNEATMGQNIVEQQAGQPTLRGDITRPYPVDSIDFLHTPETA